MPGPADPDKVFSEVRANIAFEHMIVAVLIAAAVSGAALFLLNAFFLIAKGAGSVSGVLSLGFNAVYFTFIAFLIGFLAAVVVGLPLFLALEKMKLRKVWPYVVAAILIEYAALSVRQGRVLMIDDLALPAGAVFFLPGILAAYLFGRRMRPIWRAAERAESQPAVYRVH
jgi:hypothetical protein